MTTVTMTMMTMIVMARRVARTPIVALETMSEVGGEAVCVGGVTFRLTFSCPADPSCNICTT